MNKSDSFELIEYQAADGIARIAHNRPQARNAESQGLLEELDRALGLAVR
ncbi:enoyl-CoA hydratase, partial [Bordetella bronchiseptica]